jgi:predicted alpha-1,6-mannanase (GH76 family)
MTYRLVGVRVALVVIAATILGAVPVVRGAVPARAATTVCQNGVCDGRDPGTAAQDIQMEPAFQWGRRIVLHLSYPDGMGWANIDSGSPGDETWLDRTFDGGRTWDAKLGDTFIPNGAGGWRTLMYFIDDPLRGSGQLRACGKAGDRPEIACTAWLPICDQACDGQDPAHAVQDRLLQPAFIFSRSIALHYSEPNGMAWASIDNGSPGDEVWMDRSFDGGQGWESQLGDTSIPSGAGGWRTFMFNVGGGQLRACGKASNRPDIVCTSWLPVCSGACDGKDPAAAQGDRSVDPLSWVWWRKLTLHISDGDGMAWASIERGQAGDEVWVDRSWDNGATVGGGKLGDTFIPSGSTGWRTWMYNFDDPDHGGTGVLRACGKAGDRTDIACTPWIHASDTAPDFYAGGVDSLMARYDSGLKQWGWWTGARDLTALLGFIARTGDCGRWSTVEDIYANSSQANNFANFENTYMDDTGWWAIAWLQASDVAAHCGPSEAARYLAMAETDFDYINRVGWDTTVCGGGVWWNLPGNSPQYTGGGKASIANGLFMELGARLYNRTHVARYLQAAQATWAWYQRARVINGQNLVVDGVDGSCSPVGGTFTYNQGVLVAALTEMYRATGTTSYLDRADAITNATVTDLTYPASDPRAGMLADGCELTNACGTGDGDAFKGAAIRGLRLLYDQDAALGRSTYGWRSYFLRQVQSIEVDDRSAWTEYGTQWGGPIRLTSADTAATQGSALEAFNAAAGL